MEVKNYFNRSWVGIVENGLGLLGHGTVKSSVSQEWINELSWLFTCWYQFRKSENYFKNFWAVVVRTGHGLLGHGTPKYVSQNELMNWADFLHADTNSGKLKVSLIITRLIVINIAPLTELFCNCPLADMKLPTVKRHKFQCKVLVWCD